MGLVVALETAGRFLVGRKRSDPANNATLAHAAFFVAIGTGDRGAREADGVNVVSCQTAASTCNRLSMYAMPFWFSMIFVAAVAEKV